MNTHLKDVLENIGEHYKDHISDDSNHYLEVSIGKGAEKLGYPEFRDRYLNTNAIVPLKKPVGGMKVMIDGRTFVDYAKLETGIAVPGFVARDAGVDYGKYVAAESMVLNL